MILDFFYLATVEFILKKNRKISSEHMSLNMERSADSRPHDGGLLAPNMGAPLPHWR